MKRNKQQILADIRRIKSSESSYSLSVVRADPYTLVAEKVVEKVPNSEVFGGMSFGQVRAFCKKPVMTTMYNSKQQPIDAFGEDTPELSAFYSALQELFPGALDVLEAINNVWDNEALFHEWTTPDGHVAHCKVMDTVHGVLETESHEFKYQYHNNQCSDSATSLAPNFVHSLDGFLVRYVQLNADFRTFAVHDDFKCHPNNMTKLVRLIKDAFLAIISFEPLQKLLAQDLDIDYTAIKAGIEESQYIVC